MNIQTRFNNERVLLILKERYAFVLLIVLLIGFSVVDARFRTLDNYFVIGRQATIVAIVAISATFVISSKEIDLGVGAYASLISMAVSLLLLAGMNFLLASLIGVVIGMTVGFVNGLLTAKVGVPSFLGTLGMMGICDGLAKSLTDSPSVAIYNRQFASFWCNAKVLGVPTLILWLIVFLLISIFVYNYTPFGNYVKATGGNRVAARYSGINTDRIVIMVMTISGAFAGICGLFLTARMNQGRPDFGSGLGLDAVTAAILGGTPFSGGKGSIFLSLMGALVLATLQDGLIIMGLTTELINIVKGVIIIAAVAISSNRGSR